jgi:hypothetical protein
VSSGGFGASVAETGRDAAAETIGQGEVILGVDQELVEEAFGLVGDVAVVFRVEAGGQDGVCELALVPPMVWEVLACMIPVSQFCPPYHHEPEEADIDPENHYQAQQAPGGAKNRF